MCIKIVSKEVNNLRVSRGGDTLETGRGIGEWK